MADVRDASGSSAPQGVIYDFGRARQRVDAAEPATETDSAGITEAAQELSRAREAVEAAPATRSERVRALKQQIQNGNYQPDAKEIARQILERGF
jgi:flagellar biosynthesis anti-sigma factor FlgM